MSLANPADKKHPANRQNSKRMRLGVSFADRSDSNEMRRGEIDQFCVLGKDVTVGDADKDSGSRPRTNGGLMSLTERIS